jgi:hypothetical protein
MNANRSNQARPSANQQRAASQPADDQAEGRGNEYFNLHTDGVGYAYDVRWITPNGRSKDKFLAVRIKALRGLVTEPNYTAFDLRVSGEEAISVINDLIPLQGTREQPVKILIAFRIGDTYPDPYMGDEFGEDGKRTGKKVARASIKGRLLLVKSIKIDGDLWYQRPETDDAGDTNAMQLGGGDEGGQSGGDEPPAGEGQPGDDESSDSNAPAARANVPANVMSQPCGARAPYAPQRSARTSGTRAAVSA